MLAAGQLSARWTIEGGHTSRRGVIVATLVKAGPPPEQPDMCVAGGGPSTPGPLQVATLSVTWRPGWIEHSGPAKYLVSDREPSQAQQTAESRDTMGHT